MGLFQNLFPPKVASDVIALLIKALDGVKDARVSMGIPQLESGLLRFSRANPNRERNYIGFTYFPKVSSRFEDPRGRSLRVVNISVKDKTSSATSRLSIYFSRGLICGYALEKGNFDPDLASIDNSDATLEFLDTPDEEVVRLIGAERQHLINWSDVFEVDLMGTEYIHLKEIGHGDFIGIDRDGGFYEITQDPFEIKPIQSDAVEDFLNSSRP